MKMEERQSISDESAAIQTVIESWAAAVRGRDFEGILQNHSSDIIMFDVPPPFQSKGLEAYKKTWDLFFSCSNDPIVFDVATMAVTAGSDVAFAVVTMRCTEPTATGERQDLEFRLTVGLQKIDGRWIITHEHHSVPAEN